MNAFCRLVKWHARWGFPVGETAQCTRDLGAYAADCACRLRAQTPHPAAVPWRAAPLALLALLVVYVPAALWLFGLVAAGDPRASYGLAALVLVSGWLAWGVRFVQLRRLESEGAHHG